MNKTTRLIYKIRDIISNNKFDDKNLIEYS